MAQNTSLARPDFVLDVAGDAEPAKDYFVRKDGLVYAGTHVLVDFWGATNLDDADFIEQTLRDAAAACDATLLHTHTHRFSPNGGVSGVAVLAESHISVHTWPEMAFAAFDVFMCGACDPMRAVPVLRRAFSPDRVTIGEQKRGVIG